MYDVSVCVQTLRKFTRFSLGRCYWTVVRARGAACVWQTVRTTHQTAMSRSRPGFFQRESTADSAAEAARAWLSYAPNKMSLPHNNRAADTDGDGVIDKAECACIPLSPARQEGSRLQYPCWGRMHSVVRQVVRRALLSSRRFELMFNAASAHASAESAKLFALVDKDGDGVLTEEELKGVRRAPHTSPAYRPAHTAFACDLTLRFTLLH